MTVGEIWIEVLFDLRGPHDERLRVEVFHPKGIEQVASCLVNGYFNVAGTGPRDTTTPDAPAGDQHWQEHFEDAAIRHVFLHLQQHSAVTEQS